MKIHYVCSLFFLICPCLAFSQEDISPGVSESAWNAIQAQVTSLLGNYQINDVVNVDSSLGNRFVADGAITNPYNTLANCFIFVAREEAQSEG